MIDANIEQEIWNRLFLTIKNPCGVAAIMGNLMLESSLNPLCMTGANRKYYVDSRTYADLVNHDTLDRKSFSKDGIAFGLAQWCYYTRKEALYDFAKGKDIGSPEVQIDFLLTEMPKYKTVWEAVINATDIITPCNIIMKKYEKPAKTDQAALDRRVDEACKYYLKYSTNSSTAAKELKKMVVTTMNKVNIRLGNGTNFGIVTQIENKRTMYPWVATSENGWHAILYKNRVLWVSGEYSVIEEVY